MNYPFKTFPLVAEKIQHIASEIGIKLCFWHKSLDRSMTWISWKQALKNLVQGRITLTVCLPRVDLQCSVITSDMIKYDCKSLILLLLQSTYFKQVL